MQLQTGGLLLSRPKASQQLNPDRIMERCLHKCICKVNWAGCPAKGKWEDKEESHCAPCNNWCSCKLSCQWHSLFQPQPWCHQPQECFGDHWTETLFLWVVLRNSSSTLQLLTSSFTLVSQQTLTPPWVDQASVNALLCCEKDLLAIVGYFRLWAECFASILSAIHSLC